MEFSLGGIFVGGIFVGGIFGSRKIKDVYLFHTSQSINTFFFVYFTFQEVI